MDSIINTIKMSVITHVNINIHIAIISITYIIHVDFLNMKKMHSGTLSIDVNY